MEEKVITIKLRGMAAEKLRETQNKPKRIDWTGFSALLDKENSNV